jgi:hypothetical protein
MKGLTKIPTISDLAFAYRQLQTASPWINLSELALYSQWARFDPRLAEQLVHHFAIHWKKMAAGLLNLEVGRQPWPASLAVLLEHTKTLVGKERVPFAHWVDIVTHGIIPADHELFFIGLYTFAGKQLQQECSHTIKPYSRWGYMGSELLTHLPKKNHHTLMKRKQRLQLLNGLLEKRGTIKVDDYLQLIGPYLSRRQAQRDLADCNTVQKKGATRGRVYQFKL